MKILHLAILLPLLATINSCKKDNYTLPPETQTGANTFGCKVDGKVWVPKGSDGYSGTNKKTFYQHIYPGPQGYVFNISAANYDKDPLEGFVIGVDSMAISPNITYQIQNGVRGKFGATLLIDGSIDNSYSVVNPLIGEIYFTRFDLSNQIASGTFWFDAKHKISGKIIHVTEGSFDLKFTR